MAAPAPRGQGARLQRTQSRGTLSRQARAREIVFMQQAAHIVPVALIQFTDFASDVMVIVQLATMDGAGVEWILCALAVSISLVVVWFSFSTQPDFHRILNWHEKLLGCLLACGNLHVLYVGMLYISAVHSGASRDRTESLQFIFTLFKMLETCIESIVLGLVTAGAFFRTLDDGGSGLALFASSLALSLLSMTYGFFGRAVCPYGDSNFETIKRKASIGRRHPALFLCLLVHLCWGLAAFGSLAAAAGLWWWLGLAAMAALGLVRCFLEAKMRYPERGVMIWSLSAAQEFWLGLLIDYEFLLKSDLPSFQRAAFAVARRAVLFGVAATAVALNPSAAIAAVLGALFLADLLCSPHALRMIGYLKWDPLSVLLNTFTRPAFRVAHLIAPRVGQSHPSRARAVPPCRSRLRLPMALSRARFLPLRQQTALLCSICSTPSARSAPRPRGVGRRARRGPTALTSSAGRRRRCERRCWLIQLR